MQDKKNVKKMSEKSKKTILSKEVLEKTGGASKKARCLTASKSVKETKETKGGSVLGDMTKLAVPFGLFAAKSSLENFISNRKKNLKK